jgi:hypothetical protein
VKRNRTQPNTQPVPAVPETAAELEGARVVERPDGFWVQPVNGGHELGPYATLVEAIEAYRAPEPDDVEPEETLAELEAQVGVADWIDPETSAPAEDGVPHLEEH